MSQPTQTLGETACWIVLVAKVTHWSLEQYNVQLEPACVAHYIVPEAKLVAWALGFRSAQLGRAGSSQSKCRYARWKCKKWAEVSDDVSSSVKLTEDE